MAGTGRPADAAELARVAQAASSLLRCAPEHVVVSEVACRFFRTWRFWRAEDASVPPTVVSLASDSARVVRIEMADGLESLVLSEPAAIRSADDALAYVAFLLSLTRPLAAILRSIDDVPLASGAVRKRWAASVRPPRAAVDGAGYAVDAWLLDSGDLIRARFALDARGAIRPRLETVEKGAGLAISVE